MTRHGKKQVSAPETPDAVCDGFVPQVHGAPEADEAPQTVWLDSTITCPECDSATRVRMPTDACQFFWECPACGALLKPNPGDCCVFCSWGNIPCPPIQASRDCCA